jgi:anti-sigma regulatory factor (Ser/Thr protein kinase)
MTKNMNKYELEVENRLDQLAVISDFVEDALSHFGADTATLNRVQLVIDEAATNVIKYAYSGGVGRLTISLELIGDDLVINLVDWGTPFDPNTIPPPDLEADVDNRKIGGLGIYFMRKLMDRVTYTFNDREGNHLTMIKRLTKTV